ncbi:MAG: hypothetical protein QXF23_00875 [Candidatus Bathyarchaeia archaeon]
MRILAQHKKVGIAFIVPGVVSLVFSILKNSSTLAFIGLGLTFWGALFFFIRPERLIHRSLLDSTALSIYAAADRIIRDLKIGSNGYYIPPYPKDAHVPEHLKGLKETILFISEEAEKIPPIEEIAQRKFLVKSPRGICIPPPGLGILDQIEKEIGKDLASVQLSDLSEIMPQVLIGDLQLAKDIEIDVEENQVHVTMVNPAYQSLYTSEDLSSVHFLGCPLASAIACAIAKSTGKVVAIQKIAVSRENQTFIVKVSYRIIEARA